MACSAAGPAEDRCPGPCGSVDELLDVSDVVDDADEPGVGVPADCRTRVTGYACCGCWALVAVFDIRR